MGRPKKEEINKKVKIGITIDRDLYKRIKDDKLKPSRIIEKLVRDYYGNKDL
jgi:post-segregation antitoxin (ccd killing protein)